MLRLLPIPPALGIRLDQVYTGIFARAESDELCLSEQSKPRIISGIFDQETQDSYRDHQFCHLKPIDVWDRRQPCRNNCPTSTINGLRHSGYMVFQPLLIASRPTTPVATKIVIHVWESKEQWLRNIDQSPACLNVNSSIPNWRVTTAVSLRQARQ